MTADPVADDAAHPSSRRNIFLVANNVEELGGVQRVTHNLAVALTAQGHRVVVVGVRHPKVTHDYGERPYGWLVLNEQPEPPSRVASGLRAGLDPRRRRARRRHEQAFEAAVQRLSEVFAEVDDGIVIAMQIGTMNWIRRADTGHLRVVGMSHESYEASLHSSRYARVSSFFRDVDLFLLLTQHDADQFEKDGFNNVGVMHNALSFYPEASAGLDAKVVVAAGRYAPEKGFDRLIDAFASVAPEHPDWTLKIFGHGPLEEQLRARVARVGMEQQILLPGLAGDMAEEFRGASVFALSSIHEGLPMALAEAMACGLACVAFDCAGGVRELVTDGVDGLLVPPRDVAALAGGLRAVIEDEGLRRRLGTAARVSVRRYAPDTVLADWERVLAAVER
jgi:glycosyltransferase involved in cell wall biosynthesis